MSDEQLVRLWPDPEYMHKYLDNWKAYIEMLELSISRISDIQNAERNEAAGTIAELKRKLDTVEAPLNRQIEELRQKLARVEQQVNSLEADRRASIHRLAEILEIPAAGVLSLGSAIDQVWLLVDESKKMVREHL